MIRNDNIHHRLRALLLQGHAVRSQECQHNLPVASQLDVQAANLLEHGSIHGRAASIEA